MNRRILLAAGVASLAGATVAGCTTTSIAPQPPKVVFRDVSIAPASRLAELRLMITVEAANPNRFDLPLTALRFDMEVAGQPLASGAARDERVLLPALQSRDVALEVTVPSRRLLEALRAALRPQDGGLPYRLAGSVRWGDSGFALPFERRGTLDLSRALGGLVR